MPQAQPSWQQTQPSWTTDQQLYPLKPTSPKQDELIAQKQKIEKLEQEKRNLEKRVIDATSKISKLDDTVSNPRKRKIRSPIAPIETQPSYTGDNKPENSCYIITTHGSSIEDSYFILPYGVRIIMLCDKHICLQGPQSMEFLFTFDSVSKLFPIMGTGAKIGDYQSYCVFNGSIPELSIVQDITLSGAVSAQKDRLHVIVSTPINDIIIGDKHFDKQNYKEHLTTIFHAKNTEININASYVDIFSIKQKTTLKEVVNNLYEKQQPNSMLTILILSCTVDQEICVDYKCSVQEIPYHGLFNLMHIEHYMGNVSEFDEITQIENHNKITNGLLTSIPINYSVIKLLSRTYKIYRTILFNVDYSDEVRANERNKQKKFNSR